MGVVARRDAEGEPGLAFGERAADRIAVAVFVVLGVFQSERQPRIGILRARQHIGVGGAGHAIAVISGGRAAAGGQCLAQLRLVVAQDHRTAGRAGAVKHRLVAAHDLDAVIAFNCRIGGRRVHAVRAGAIGGRAIGSDVQLVLRLAADHRLQTVSAEASGGNARHRAQEVAAIGMGRGGRCCLGPGFTLRRQAHARCINGDGRQRHVSGSRGGRGVLLLCQGRGRKCGGGQQAGCECEFGLHWYRRHARACRFLFWKGRHGRAGP